jgi:hypothetical protein
VPLLCWVPLLCPTAAAARHVRPALGMPHIQAGAQSPSDEPVAASATYQGGGAADLLAGGIVLGAVARALELVLGLRGGCCKEGFRRGCEGTHLRRTGGSCCYMGVAEGAVEPPIVTARHCCLTLLLLLQGNNPRAAAC